MLNAVIIDEKDSESIQLLERIKRFCPFLDCKGIINSQVEIGQELANTVNDIFFINPECIPKPNRPKIREACNEQKPIICINNSSNFAELAVAWKSTAYLRKPVKTEYLVKAVEEARKKIRTVERFFERELLLTSLLKSSQNKDLIGIPSIKGFEILSVTDIVKCEGLQKCTKIVVHQKGSIVSSYSIGMFKKLLAPYPVFFSPHRSHIINLRFVKEYQKCGIILLKNNSCVPITKGKKEGFLSKFLHL